MLNYFRNRRRRHLLAQPFPSHWLSILHGNVRLYGSLTSPQQMKLRDDLRIFIAERYWESADDLVINDEVQVTIAAHAALLALNLDPHIDWYRPVKTIIMHSGSFISVGKQMRSGGVISEGSANSGEAWHNGPVILSWNDTVWGGRNTLDGRNLALHEFAHVLDMADGLSNGTPPLTERIDGKTWHRTMTDAYEQLIDDAEFGHATLLDVYGATNVAEFFAVATEAFFERGQAMRQLLPELYATMRAFYGQDPALWRK